MTNQDERWGEVGSAVMFRRAERGYSRADLERMADVSEPTIRHLEQGKPRGDLRPDTRHRLCVSLGWVPNSLDEILAGREPIKIDVALESANFALWSRRDLDDPENIDLRTKHERQKQRIEEWAKESKERQDRIRPLDDGDASRLDRITAVMEEGFSQLDARMAELARSVEELLASEVERRGGAPARPVVGEEGRAAL